MNPEIVREIEDTLRAMRQAFNSQDMKSYRNDFWTNPRFLHVDSSGRVDKGWGAFEEVLDQEFRYLDKVNGSRRNIAGIINAAGNVLGMMPHPERAIKSAHGGSDGRKMFEGAIEALASA